MPVTVVKLPDDPIVVATTLTPLEPQRDMPAMFGEIMRHRAAINGPSALIVDCSETMESFNVMMNAMAEASREVKKNRELGGHAPILVFVGSGLLAEIASKSMGQTQYGGVSGTLFPTKDEAVAAAREKLAAARESAPPAMVVGENRPAPAGD